MRSTEKNCIYLHEKILESCEKEKPQKMPQAGSAGPQDWNKDLNSLQNKYAGSLSPSAGKEFSGCVSAERHEKDLLEKDTGHVQEQRVSVQRNEAQYGWELGIFFKINFITTF